MLFRDGAGLLLLHNRCAAQPFIPDQFKLTALLFRECLPSRRGLSRLLVGRVNFSSDRESLQKNQVSLPSSLIVFREPLFLLWRQ